MREIKFRAWDGARKRMVDHFYIFKDGSMMIDVGGPYVALKRAENCVLMQYTGLKDKNGVEIYEGDIVVIPGSMPINHPEYENDIVEVVMNTGSWSYRHHPSSVTEPIYSLIGNDMNQDDEAEVIGNIYENPELVLAGKGI